MIGLQNVIFTGSSFFRTGKNKAGEAEQKGISRRV